MSDNTSQGSTPSTTPTPSTPSPPSRPQVDTSTISTRGDNEIIIRK